MRKKILIPLAGTFSLLLVLKLYTDRMPDYGIRSRWKKLLLNTIVPDDVPKLSVAHARLKKEAALFLDTRTREEYNVSHIEGALFVGYSEFDTSFLNDVPKEQFIITYCSIGKRSGDIAKKLMEAGYTNVQNLYGGLFEWVNREYPVVDTQNRPTKKVHAYNKIWGIWLNRGKKVY